MQKKNIPNIPGFLVIILIFTVPPLGFGLLILKIILSASNQKNTGQTTNTTSPFSNDTCSHNETRNERENVYSDNTNVVHQHSRKRKSKEKVLYEDVTVRCPNCEALCFTDRFPFDCEFCGQHITKKK